MSSTTPHISSSSQQLLIFPHLLQNSSYFLIFSTTPHISSSPPQLHIFLISSTTPHFSSFPPQLLIFPHLLHNSSFFLIFSTTSHFSSSAPQLLNAYSSPHLSLHNKYKSTELEECSTYPGLW